MLAAILILVVWLWFRSEQILPAPDGVSERDVLHVGPMLLAGVEDSMTEEIIFWYDLDSGPDLTHIERLDNGDWVVTLTPRK